MKKLFPIAVFSAALMFVACGDDSSSGPAEESSSSIEAEDESSSSHSGEGAPESSEESGDAKSSAEEKDAKSSSSEAKKDDSSSSEETTSSSSEVSSSSEITRSSDWDVNKLYCDVKVEGNLLTVKYGVGGVFEENVEQDASAPKVSFTYEGSSCENIDDFDFIGSPNGTSGISCEVSDCVAGNKWAKKTLVCTSDPSESDKFLLLEAEMEASFCNDFMSAEVTTEYLNQKMLDEGKYGVMVDTRDYSYLIYRTIQIGTQTWMAQNLNYDPGNVSSMGSYAWSGCYGEGNESYSEEQVAANCSKYGRLYTWEVAMDKAGCGYGNDCNNSNEGTQGVCPNGWHLPSKDEFETLLGSVGSSDKERSANLTALSWGNGQDKFGFSALPAGYYYSYYEEFNDLGDYAYFWSSTEDDEFGAYNLSLDDYGAYVYGSYENYGHSVRCLKDDAPSQSVSSN